jgi:hypothetical protein
LNEYAADEEQEDREQKLRQTIDRLNRKLAESKAKEAELVDAVYQAALDGISGLTLPKIIKKPAARGDSITSSEVCVPMVSDLQLAKVTPDYNSEVCEQRMERYATKIIEMADIQRAHHPVTKCVVPCLGDIIEGELIFPGQSFLIDSSLYRQVTVDGPRIMYNFLATLLTSFDEVEVHWVIGNHGAIGGRSRRDMDPETNADRMLGRILQLMFTNEPRISFVIPDGPGERNWYDIMEIGGYSAMLLHGDQMRGHSGIPFYGFQKKINSWAAGAIRDDFQDVYMGHWHQRSLIPLNTRNVYVNGSTESYNTYAQEQLAAMSDPSQWLLFVHPGRGRVTASYGVDLLD